MLAQTLQQLEGDGLVIRRSYPVVPPHVEYTLTPFGQEAASHVEVLTDWIEDRLPALVERRGVQHGQEVPGSESGAYRHSSAQASRARTTARRGRLHLLITRAGIPPLIICAPRVTSGQNWRRRVPSPRFGGRWPAPKGPAGISNIAFARADHEPIRTHAQERSAGRHQGRRRLGSAVANLLRAGVHPHRGRAGGGRSNDLARNGTRRTTDARGRACGRGTLCRGA